MNAKNQAPQFVTAPEADLSDKGDAEVWLDLVTAAVGGYCGAAWGKKNGDPINTLNSQIAARMATEVADAVFVAYKKRRK